MNERGLKKSGIPGTIGVWFQSAIEINTIRAVLCILLVRHMLISLWNPLAEILEICKILFWQGSSYYTFKDSALPGQEGPFFLEAGWF